MIPDPISDRLFSLNTKPTGEGPIVYWMSRDQRVHDNHALITAQRMALSQTKELRVAFCLVPDFLGAGMRQYAFMLAGLEEVERELAQYNISFDLFTGDPDEQVPAYVRRFGAGAIVVDFDPLRVKRRWADAVARSVACAVFEVDAHNIVPCRVASPKREYGAHTFRPKVGRLLPTYLTEYPRLKIQSRKTSHTMVHWRKVRESLRVDATVASVGWCVPGEKAARSALTRFIRTRLSRYAEDRNDPSKHGQSDLSPYVHFGQISAQRIALEVRDSGAPPGAVEAFLEELIVRRELADNFCLHTPSYDTPDGFPSWATKTLADHAGDIREYRYDRSELEHAMTHDPLWNAAQTQMVRTGKMHGYMRMYWAKKILEWAAGPEEAMRWAVYLNDKYELDGRDPNGYAGIAWSIGGVHDRPWFSRRVFGMVRYMSSAGVRSKFDADAYIGSIESTKT